MKKFNMIYERIMESLNENNDNLKVIADFLKKEGKNFNFDKILSKYENKYNAKYYKVFSPGKISGDRIVITTTRDGDYTIKVSSHIFDDHYVDFPLITRFKSKQDLISFLDNNGASNLISKI